MGRAPCCDKANVKKGPWSPEEDAKLKSFIDQNGTGGNWITLPSKAGLKRCGKSCRLRWINYLRPDIKHGSFTEEEERTIYRYHAQIGSRWSVIAAQLPGRTDNDIKNYWNTRLKKKLLERGNTGAQRYGRFLHPYQQIPAHQFGVEDQMANAAAREGLLHGQHSYLPQQYQQLYQQQYLPQQMQHQHQLVLPTVLRHHMDMRNQQPTSVAPANGAVERERLMAIESSLRSIIVPDAAATGGGGANSHLLLSHRGSGSSDRNSLGIQIADSDVVGDPAANTSILGPQPQTLVQCTVIIAPSGKMKRFKLVTACTSLWCFRSRHEGHDCALRCTLNWQDSLFTCDSTCFTGVFNTSDLSINSTFVDFMKVICPSNAPSSFIALDSTEQVLDTAYFTQCSGLETNSCFRCSTHNDFAASMVKLGAIQVLTDARGYQKELCYDKLVMSSSARDTIIL